MEPPKSAEYGAVYDRLMRQSALNRWTHIVLALVAAGVYESQKGFSHYAFWRSSGGAILAMLILPVWPYLVSGASVWGRTTTNWVRAWILWVTMIVITTLVCLWYLSNAWLESGLWWNIAATLIQASAFGVVGRWTFEDSFDEI